MRMQHKLSFLLFWICVSLLQNATFALQSEAIDYLQLKNLSGTRGGNIIVAVSADPSSFSRMMATGLPGVTITDRLSADLVHINRSSMELEPALATQWEADKTGRVFTLHIRRGLRFSDGSPFSVEDVVFTLQMLMDPKVQCPLAGQLEVDGTFPSIKKVNDSTIQLSFPRPVGMGLRMLDSVPMLPKKALLKAYQEGRIAEVWGPTVNPVEVVGMGPFRIKEYQRGIKLVLERNPYYWKKDRLGQTLPYLDSITFLIVPDLNSEALRFQQGELDMISSPSLSPENYAAMRRMQKKFLLRDLGPGITMDFLWFNLNQSASRAGKSRIDPEKLAIFEKPEFRLAISHAIDRDGMVRSILLGLGNPQYSPVSSGNKQWFHEGLAPTRFNPVKSRELLAQIGLKDSNRDGILEYGKMPHPLEVSLFTSRGNNIREKAAQIIRDNLSKVGIRVAIQTLLPNEIAARFLGSFDYESILFGFTGTDITPDLQTNLWYSSGNIHFWQPNQEKPERAWEATIDTLISKLVRSLAPSERKAVFDQAQEIWAKQMPAIPTFAPNVLAGWSNSLGNMRPSVLVPHLIWNAEEITKNRP